jgi:polyhydroxyalkanoate synthase
MQSSNPAKVPSPFRAEPSAQAPTPARSPGPPTQSSDDANSWPFERDSYASTAFSDVVDRSLHAAVSRLTAGLSPAALTEAYLDWIIHLASSPGKQAQLLEKAMRKSTRLGRHMSQCMLAETGATAQPCIEPLPIDRRFAGKEWQQWPYTFLYQSFLLQQQWWHNATTGVRGVTTQHERVVEFASRQLLDMLSPANFIATNPQVLQKSIEDGGMNLVKGWQNLIEDWERAVSGAKPVGTEAFKVGGNIAVSPGKVIYRNRLIELIQYAPTTDKVRPEPVLIVPAWIMKYYILDLSQHNSLVRYLTDQGFTVFMVSWKNPDPGDRDLGMQDYSTLGITAALDAVSAVLPQTKIHGVGYCLGGTLLAATAAAMARDGDDRLQSLTMLAAQTDFSEAGELMLFINESQLSFLEDTMWEQGFLDTKQMAGAFQLLRSNDLIWSRMIHDYLMGEREPMNDLMAWNADATRMPYRMHSEYLRHMFLENDLSEGRFIVGEKPVALTDIRAPIFAVGTLRDHVAPWRSVFKVHLLTDTDVTFLLASGGHNAGIVSEPGHNGRSYQVQTKSNLDRYTSPETWAASTPTKNGSWWPEWTAWLAGHSGSPTAPPPMGAENAGLRSLCDAPGTYVMQD